MKKAVGYIRISDKDQSNFSIDAQKKHIYDYANKHNTDIVSFFIDDGKSAKNFDRPNWRQLEEFIRQHFRQIDYLIVVKYDRFSRNASEGLHKIEMLERRFKIIIASVFEQMFIDYDSPFFFKQRADMLVNAEFELHVIRDRTRFGMHHALSEGRYVSMAPYGYKNTRDENKKPLIVVDEARAIIVKKIFEDYLSGVPTIEIYRQAKALGLSLRGHSTIPDILKNPVYAGMVNVPAYRKEPAKIVKAIHEPIVSETMWWECQRRLGVLKNRTVLNESVPLRSILHCEHGIPLTAGESRGRSHKYWYYKSNHCGLNVSAKRIHDKFDELLKNLSLEDEYINFLKKESADEMEVLLKERNRNLKSCKSGLSKLENDITRLEEKFFSDQINHDTYTKWSKIYQSQIGALRNDLTRLESGYDHYWKLYNAQLYKLSDIHYLYYKMDLLDKRLFVKQVFNSTLYYCNDVYRTAYLLDILRHNELILKEKQLLYIDDKINKNNCFAVGAPERS
ncbi:MAG: recombinase family protein [Chitinophagaceae bacterium]|nr:recombinase family protein [Chitinophagaceae bacterium]